MDTGRPDAGDTGTTGPSPSPKQRRPNTTILLAFLGVFVLLLVVFREVLFPFLMAMFIAYLVEPVVAWVTKSRLFGVKWTRGPTIVLIYILVLGGAAFGVWKGLIATASFVRDTSQEVAEMARETASRAVFEVPASVRLERPLVVPAGTRLVAEGLEFETRYRVRLTADERRASSILRRLPLPAESATDPDEKPPELAQGVPIALADAAAMARANEDLPEGFRLEVAAGFPAKGLEIALERELVSPIVENLEQQGVEIEPTSVREFVALKANAWSAELPGRLGKGALAFAGQIALSVYEFFLILMLTAFIVMDRRAIARFFASLPPDQYKPSYHKLVEYIDDGLAGVIRGQLVICGVNGVLTYVGLLLLGVKAAVVLSVVAAVLSLIPIFGTIVSSIPIVLIAATDGIDKGVFALLWIVFIHMLEANMLNPLIMGSHARMHPVIIVFALLAGEHSFGVWGALLAVPTMSLIQSCFRFYLHEIEGLPPEGPGDGPSAIARAWAWVRARFRKPEVA